MKKSANVTIIYSMEGSKYAHNNLVEKEINISSMHAKD